MEGHVIHEQSRWYTGRLDLIMQRRLNGFTAQDFKHKKLIELMKVIILPKAYLRISKGGGHVHVCKLFETSRLWRAYASCCFTPLFNMHGDPFGTRNPLLFALACCAEDGPGVFGKQKVHFYASSATMALDDSVVTPGVDIISKGLPPLSLFLRLSWLFIKCYIGGKGKPNPLQPWREHQERPVILASR